GIRKTTVVWYAWLRGVRTTKSCAIAAVEPSTRNVAQPGVSARSFVTSGTDAAAATTAITKKYAVALNGGFPSRSCSSNGPGTSGSAPLHGIAHTSGEPPQRS